MSTNKETLLKEKKRKVNKRNINLSYAIVGAVCVLLLFVNYAILSDLGTFSWSNFIVTIAGNLMGVLAAFLIFDIIHEKLSKDSYADEVSEQILDTLVEQDGIEALDEDIRRKFITASLCSLDNDKEAANQISSKLESYLKGGESRDHIIDNFNFFEERQKFNFVKNNVTDIMNDDDSSSMINGFLNTYLQSNNNCRIRTAFEYNFELRDSLPTAFDVFKHKEKYFFVEETLTYTQKALNDSENNLDSNIISIGFAYDNASLDKFLRDEQVDKAGELLTNCIFRESLDIEPEDIAYFASLPSDKLTENVNTIFKPHLTIDGCQGSIVEAKVLDCGIVVDFKVAHDQKKLEHTIDIVLDMPKRWHSVLHVYLGEPTKDPKISLSYSGDTMLVERYSFLNKSENTSYESAHIDDIGIYRFILNNTWIYPESGVVFTIDKKQK